MSKKKNEWEFTVMPEDFDYERIVTEALDAGYDYGVIDVKNRNRIHFLRKEIYNESRLWEKKKGIGLSSHNWTIGRRFHWTICLTLNLKAVSGTCKTTNMSSYEIMDMFKEIVAEYKEQQVKLLTVKVECY